MNTTWFSFGEIADDEIRAAGKVFIATVKVASKDGPQDVWLGEIRCAELMAAPHAYNGRLMNMTLDRREDWSGQVRIYLHPDSVDDDQRPLRFVGFGPGPFETWAQATCDAA